MAMLKPQAQTIPVAIVGGGPVGLLLALFLDRYGVRSVSFNSEPQVAAAIPRAPPRTPAPWSTTGGSASRAGPRSRPADRPIRPTLAITPLHRWELGRIRMPSEADKRRAVLAAAPRPTRRPSRCCAPTRCTSRRSCSSTRRTRPNITIRFGWQVDKFDGRYRRGDVAGAAHPAVSAKCWRAQYLVGCDGGAQLRAPLARRCATTALTSLNKPHMGGRHERAHTSARRRCFATMPGRPAAAGNTGSINPERPMHSSRSTARTSSSAFSPAELEPTAWRRRRSHCEHGLPAAVGAELPMQIIGHRPWTAGVALVAERFGDGPRAAGRRCRASVHADRRLRHEHRHRRCGQPRLEAGGLVQGWGGSNLLNSYEIERKPIAERNTVAARDLAKRDGIDADPTEEMEENRRRRGGAARGQRTPRAFGEEFASIGVQLGARYDGSPIIAGRRRASGRRLSYDIRRRAFRAAARRTTG